MLNQYLKYLLKKDDNFISYWCALDEDSQVEYVNNLLAIESLYSGYDKVALISEISKKHEAIKRIFVKIPHINLSLFRIPDGWNSFIKNENEKKKLFQLSNDMLSKHIQVYDLSDVCYLYGNIKSNASLDRKIMTDYMPNNSSGTRDIWDIIRFRMVASNLFDLLYIATTIWDEYYDNILKCYNYYSNPKNNDPLKHYRGIHFEIFLQPDKIVELQLVTKSVDSVSYIEHSVMFKKLLPFQNNLQESWLKTFVLKSLLFDYNNLVESELINKKLPLTSYIAKKSESGM